MKKALFYTVIVSFILFVSACSNPYKGFKGVDKKGMKGKKPPSVKLVEDYEKNIKKNKKISKKEMKRRKKEYGSPN